MNERCNGCGKRFQMRRLVVYGQNSLAFDRHYCRVCWPVVSQLAMDITGEWPRFVRAGGVRDPWPMV